MLKIGDIVSLSSPNEKADSFIVIGINDKTDSLTAISLTKKTKKYTSTRFAENILDVDLEEGCLHENRVVLVDELMTVKQALCTKIAKLKKGKLDMILRTFAHYAGYSYYKSTSDNRIPASYIPPSGKVLDENELFSMIDASLDMWLTAGRFHDEFENRFAEFLGVKHVLTVNSGSSANLLAVSALKSHKLGDKKLKEGDEVITVAAAFPTTVAPLVQNGLIPVFTDIETGTYNIDPTKIENAMSDKTKAICIAHTLGNPFDIDKVAKLCKRFKLFLIEDNCDALGSKYVLATGMNESNKKYTGTFGDIATFSFYPAHHITMGEGGAVATDDPLLNKIMLSIRDWGRDCWCPTGKDNTCKQRFSQRHGKLPTGYDHKYVYSHLGYNMKITDWQAAIGIEQLKKLPKFIERRKENFRLLHNGLKRFEEYLILPRTVAKGDAAWFGFPITVKENKKFNKNKMVRFLEEHNIGTRQLFAGNVLRQPFFLNNEIKMRIGNSKILLSNSLTDNDYKMMPYTDMIMANTFWIGIWPGLQQEQIEYMTQKIEEFLTLHG